MLSVVMYSRPFCAVPRPSAPVQTIHRTLRTYTKANKLLPIMYTKVYMYQIARSLSYIHSLGVCHRDIKPQVRAAGRPDQSERGRRGLLACLSSFALHCVA